MPRKKRLLRDLIGGAFVGLGGFIGLGLIGGDFLTGILCGLITMTLYMLIIPLGRRISRPSESDS